MEMSMSGFISMLLSPWNLVVLIPMILFKMYLLFSKGKFTAKDRMDGKTVLITGANTGIGFETARVLAERGARVLLACRSTQNGTEAKERIIKMTGNENIEFYKLDLSSLASIRQFAEEVLAREPQLNVLINNAGAGGLKSKKTEDGLQILWQVNHFGPFLLTNLLLGLVKKSAPARIIFLSSDAHNHHHFDLDNFYGHKFETDWTTYCNTKLANILTTKFLAKRLDGTGVTVNAVHPGLVKTDIFRRVRKPILKVPLNFILNNYAKTPEEGAATTLTVAIDSKLDKVTGQYFMDCKESDWVAKEVNDLNLAQRLWERSEELVGLKENEKFY